MQAKNNDIFYQWYIVTTVSGNEDSVAKSLNDKINAYKMGNLLDEIKIIKEKHINEEIYSKENAPSTINKKQKNVTWETIDCGNGIVKYKKTKITLKNRYPGYIFMHICMTDDVWFVIRNTNLVTGIVGSSGKNAKPIPVSDEEMQRMLSNCANPVKQSIEIEDAKSNEIEQIDEIDSNSTTNNEKFDYNNIKFTLGDSVIVLDGTFANEIGVVKSIDKKKLTAKVMINVFGRESELDFNLNHLDKVEDQSNDQ